MLSCRNHTIVLEVYSSLAEINQCRGNEQGSKRVIFLNNCVYIRGWIAGLHSFFLLRILVFWLYTKHSTCLGLYHVLPLGIRLYAFPSANLADAADAESDIGSIVPLLSLDMQELIDNETWQLPASVSWVYVRNVALCFSSSKPSRRCWHRIRHQIDSSPAVAWYARADR